MTFWVLIDNFDHLIDYFNLLINSFGLLIDLDQSFNRKLHQNRLTLIEKRSKLHQNHGHRLDRHIVINNQIQMAWNLNH